MIARHSRAPTVFRWLTRSSASVLDCRSCSSRSPCGGIVSIARVDDLLRAVLLRAGRVLPPPRRKRFARQVRGWHEARCIGRANAVVLSHAKSGRTWLATMLTAYERAAGASVGVFFSHDNYIRDWSARGAQPWHAGKRLVLLVREPGATPLGRFRYRRAALA